MSNSNEPITGTIVLTCLLYIPYIIVSLILWTLSPIEWLMRLLFRISINPFSKLTLVIAQRRIKSWIVDGPVKKFEDRGGFQDIFLPSLLVSKSEEHRKYVLQGKVMEQEIEDEIAICKNWIRRARQQRLSLMNKAPDNSNVITDDDVQCKAFCESVLISKRLKRHLESLEKDLENVKFLSRTQAIANRTGFRGLRHWAQTALNTHQNLMTSLAQVSFVGAGLTYSTIFGANRGDIGLMCYAFALFNFGFIVPIVAGALLSWASRRRPDALFANPSIWKVLIWVFNYAAAAAAAVAICLLNITIIQLRFPDGVSVGQNPLLQFNVIPRPAAIFALAGAGLISLTAFVGLILHYLVNGWWTVIDALKGSSDGEIPGINDYVRT